MNDQERYKRLDFIISIVKPWDDLYFFLQQPYALDTKFSDPVIQARSLAVNIQHQTDYDKCEQGAQLSDQELRGSCPAAMRIRDLCNTIKHVERNRGDHAWIDGIRAEVIVNEDGTFQFVRNRISYRHEQDGEHDLIDDLYVAAKFWALKRDIDLSGVANWQDDDLRVSPKSPQDRIYLIFDPNICIHQESQRVSINKLVDGKLVPTDHHLVSVSILDVRDNTPETLADLMG